MILRRLFCFALFCGIAAFDFAVPCSAQQTAAETDLLFTAEVLKMTLFARTEGEKRFCDYVIQKRDDGTIPVWIIYGVYQKAIAKEPSRRFTYFRMGVETLCRREGIVLYPASAQQAAQTSHVPAWVPSLLRRLF